MKAGTRNFLNREGRYAHAEARGACLAHVIGACFFLSILIGPSHIGTILNVNPFDWPIRAVAVWLLIDKLGKRQNTKLMGWDWAHLFLVAAYGCALIYADLFMMRDTGFLNYLGWINVTVNGYLYFLLVREGLTRRGFRPEIVVRWVLATLFLACVLALMQARDVAGTRNLINNFYHQAQIELHMEGPSEPWQARAPTTHANALAMLLLCGLPLLFALYDLKKFRWFDWLTAALLVVTIVMTYSRIGILALVAVALASITVWAYRKEYQKAAIALIALLAMGVVFVAAVLVFDISRLKVLVQPSSSLSSFSDRETAGWAARELSIRNSIARGEDYPLTGLKAATSALNQEELIVRNPFTYDGLLLNVYAYSFVSYGVIGVLYLLAIFWICLSQIRFARSRYAFAMSAFVLGVAMMVLGIAENVLFYDGAMFSVNIVMAFCVMRVAAPAEAPRPRAKEELPASLPELAANRN